MAADSEDETDGLQQAPVTPLRPDRASNVRQDPPSKASMAEDDGRGSEQDDEEEDEDGDDTQDGEPKLKYNRLTGSLTAVYRNGDAASSFMVAGDKLMIGTHNGNINVLTLPTLLPLRIYHAHSASITAISVSPFPPPLAGGPADTPNRPSVPPPQPPTSSPSLAPQGSGTTASPRSVRQPPVPATPSNSIYIATSSVDGHVCIASLVDQKDVMLRNFARPVHAVALSPDFKNDRCYLSGGLAGNLILTTGGRSGVSSNANTNIAAAAASGWLNSIGLGSNTGRDTILHSGEGAISTIKWSLTGKFVVWVNETGIKIMRSSLKLEGADADFAWKRIAHIDRPYRKQWEEMASVWKARAEWIDENNLEADDDDHSASNGLLHQQLPALGASPRLQPSKNGRPVTKRRRTEKLVVGWGDTAWVLHVKPEHAGTGKEAGQRIGGSATIVHHLLFDDCIISGLSLYTPSLLLVLAYRTRDDEDNPILSASPNTTPRRGVQHRRNGLSPELRLINVVTKEEVDVDTLTVSRYESLSAADYNLGTLYVPPAPVAVPTQRGAFEALSGGLWDVGVNATRIFSSAASVKSASGSGDNTVVSPSPGSAMGKSSASGRRLQEAHPAAANPGLKIFIQSPYDCVLAVKRDLLDHLTWLVDHENYKDAWELVEEHPEVVNAPAEASITEEPASSPSKRDGQSLADFFDDDTFSRTTLSVTKNHNAAVERERQRIGELWLQQLVVTKDWLTAGQVAGRVLGASPRWEHWVLAFAQAGRFDEIMPYIPSKRLHPPLPSLVYEVVLGHYISHDRLRFKELIDAWDPELFEINSVVTAIESKLAGGEFREDTVEEGELGRDWRILLETLAKLKVANGQPREALRCAIRLKNADMAMNLITESHLISAVADDIPGFLTLRVPEEALRSTPLAEIEEASADGMHLLVDEATRGTIRTQTVVGQLEGKGASFQPFIYLYLRALWKGHGTESHPHRVHQHVESEGRILVEEFGDTAVSLFADFDRTLLMEFLRASRSYSFDKATAVCEARHFYPELVYLLSQTGQTKRALSLIINSLEDVSLAIEFAKEQDDAELWDDLVEFSMDKPRFIRGLLEEVGTAIDPIKLVKRIPEGLEIEGLREGISRMIREYEIQGSISEGVARVLRGEVAAGMEALRTGRAKGIYFDIYKEVNGEIETRPEKPAEKDPESKNAEDEPEQRTPNDEPRPGHCIECKKPFAEGEKDTLIGFACGHIYHLSCLLSTLADPATAAAAERLQAQLTADAEIDDGSYTRSVGAKVAHAHIIKSAVWNGCPRCGVVQE